MIKRWEIIINHIESMADKDCTCTPKQEQGESYPECESCMAVDACNEIGDLLSEFEKDFPSLEKIK